MSPKTRSTRKPKASKRTVKRAPKLPMAPSSRAKEKKPAAKGGQGPRKKARKAAPESSADDEEEEGRDIFSTLPLDVLLEIARDLNPGTILSISQTSKAVRSTLFRKSAEPVWIKAREMSGWPKLEAGDVSEPMYAFLTQGRACQVCGLGKKTHVDHLIRVRCCSKCLQQNLRTESALLRKYPDLHNETFQCALSTPYSASGDEPRDKKPFYFLPDVLAVSNHLNALESTWLESEEEPGGEPLQPYIASRRQLKKQVARDATTLFRFEASVLDEELAEESVGRMARRREIYDKLAELGHDPRDYTHLYWSQRIFKSCTPLTDVEWNAACNDLGAIVNREKVKRLKYERERAKSDARWDLRQLYEQLRNRVSEAERKAFPPKPDWYESPSVKPLWEPENVVVKAQTWPSIFPQLLAEAKLSIRETKVELFKLIATSMLSHGSPLPDNIKTALTDDAALSLLTDADMDPIFARATALFSCAVDGCEHKHVYPDIYQHVALKHASDTDVSSPELDCEVPHRTFQVAVRQMLLRAGRDEATTTNADLEALGERFAVAGTHKKGFQNSYNLQKQTWAYITRHEYPMPRWSFWSRGYYKRSQRPKIEEDTIQYLEILPPPPPPAPPRAPPAQTPRQAGPSEVRM
ncbi:hypothetical protein JCM8097_000260 [Rhodosporidiobolus ruineniae]